MSLRNFPLVDHDSRWLSRRVFEFVRSSLSQWDPNNHVMRAHGVPPCGQLARAVRTPCDCDKVHFPCLIHASQPCIIDDQTSDRATFQRRSQVPLEERSRKVPPRVGGGTPCPHKHQIHQPWLEQTLTCPFSECPRRCLELRRGRLEAPLQPNQWTRRGPSG